MPFLSLVLCAQEPVLKEVRLRTDPPQARLQPLESLVVQVLVYGEIEEGGERRRVRLQRMGARMRIRQRDGGWLSKPFRFQGRDDEPFYEKEGLSLGERILNRAAGDFVLQDSFLYTAPDRPGRYTLEAELDGKRDSITVEVDLRAPTSRDPERSFVEEDPPFDPYRRLAEHYSPFIAQETWFQPKSDYLARYDFDQNWDGDDNWDNLESGSSQAYVYYAVMETDSHWFLIYDLFHPRDYSDKCVAGTCHENDSEGLILTVLKDGSPMGRPQAFETLAHNNIYSYRIDRKVKKGVHGFDGKAELFRDSHPAVFVESGGHGVYGSRDKHSRYRLRDDLFTDGTGVTYIYKGRAERPRHPDQRLVGYQLLPAYQELWLRAHERRDHHPRAFDDYFRYTPYGDRPGTTYDEIAGAFLGRRHGRNKAKPFWGWSDRRTKKRQVLAVGQWALDPAYAASRNLTFPQPFSLDYLHNPYLGIGDRRPKRLAADRRNWAQENESAPSQGTAFNEASASSPDIDRSDQGGRRTDGPMPLGQEIHSEWNDPRGYDDADIGSLEFRGIVDGTVVLSVRADRVFADIIDGRTLVVDGFRFSQPLPSGPHGYIRAEHLGGPCRVTPLERPTADNGFTAIIRLSRDVGDGDDDSDSCRLRLSWRRSR